MQKKITRLSFWILCVLLMAVVCANYVINSFAEGKTYSTVSEIPKNKVGLVLGTSKKLRGGQFNPYYSNRIKATVSLFKTGKIAYVLVSGDNGSSYYNEPTTMKKDLISVGIPKEKIFLDYAGFRTLDSVFRAKIVFGLKEVTIISQKFHNERAIYLASKKGLHAIGYNAKDIPLEAGLKIQFREYFARVKVFLDLALKTQPRFYGEKIFIQ